MLRLLASAHICLIVTMQSLSAADAPANSTRPQWGTIRGRVIVTGKLPPVKYHARKGDPVYYRGTIQDSIDRVPPKLAGHYPQDIRDDSLLIDEKSRGLANVFVYLRKRPAAVHPDLDRQPEMPIEIEWGNWRFEPRAVIARTGQHVRMMPSAPGKIVQVHVQATRNGGFNKLLGGVNGPVFDEVFSKAESWPMRVTNQFGLEMTRCEPQSDAYWLILDHPYGAVTLTDGSFVIPDLPVGEHELRLWHERTGWVVKNYKVTVRADETTEMTPLEVASERFVEKTN